MSTPYTTPTSDPSVPREQTDTPRYRKLAVTGSILLAGPLFGAIGTAIAMVKAFSTLSEVDGSADPAHLAGDINAALMSMIYGSLFGLIGVALVSIALFRRTNREKWFFRSVITLAILWCFLLFPIGLVVGIYLLIIFINKKTEFYPPSLPRRGSIT